MTTPSKSEKPREFWLDLASRHGDPCDFVSEGKPHEIVSSTNIHVIEISAYRKAVEALKLAECFCQSNYECIRCKTLRELGEEV